MNKNFSIRHVSLSLVVIPSTLRWWRKRFQANSKWWSQGLSFYLIFFFFSFSLISIFHPLSCIILSSGNSRHKKGMDLLYQKITRLQLVLWTLCNVTCSWCKSTSWQSRPFPFNCFQYQKFGSSFLLICFHHDAYHNHQEPCSSTSLTPPCVTRGDILGSNPPSPNWWI